MNIFADYPLYYRGPTVSEGESKKSCYLVFADFQERLTPGDTTEENQMLAKKNQEIDAVLLEASKMLTPELMKT